MAHGDAREGNWRGNWRMEWVASTLHTTSEHGVSSITTADAHISAASSRLNWTDAPADLNGLVRFAERRNLVSVCVPSHFNWSLLFHMQDKGFSQLCRWTIRCDDCQIVILMPPFSESSSRYGVATKRSWIFINAAVINYNLVWRIVADDSEGRSASSFRVEECSCTARPWRWLDYVLSQHPFHYSAVIYAAKWTTGSDLGSWIAEI